jgi:hypothetical protein
LRISDSLPAVLFPAALFLEGDVCVLYQAFFRAIQQQRFVCQAVLSIARKSTAQIRF